MSYKILIVDDSRLARMAVAKVLGRLRPDWQRVEATNADEALVLLDQASFDVALLDFNMPGRDGLSLAGELRRLWPGMAVAVISANMQDEVVNRARQAGAVFLPKPVSQDALDAFISEAEKRLEAHRP